MSVGNYSMADIAGLVKSTQTPKAERSTSREGNTELNMQDFLQLMVVQLQNQTMDDTMDTSEMMNQMVQMQMVTALTNMTETNIMTYATSLVGKVVTVGINNGENLEEREILVMGTGTYNGQQVIFGHDGNMYQLNQIMAVGRLPNEDGSYGEVQPGEGEEGSGDGGEDSGNGGDSGAGSGSVDGAGNGGAAQPPTDQTQAAALTYDGTQGAPSDNM